MGIIWEEEDFQIFYNKKKKLKAYSTFQFLKKWCPESNVVRLNHSLISPTSSQAPCTPKGSCQSLLPKTGSQNSIRSHQEWDDLLILDCPKSYISFKDYVKYYMVFLQSLLILLQSEITSHCSCPSHHPSSLNYSDLLW